ncbi:tetratricopeptide repeat protein [Myxococcota bacterium]|nr:tetratricopeptide repeat protein [Myxococcota bacterium]
MQPTATFFMACSRWMLVLALSLTAAVAVATPVTAPEDSTARQELFQARLDAVKELQQKDTAALRERLDWLDKRIEIELTQNGQAVDRFGVIAGILGTIVTLLLTLIGTAAYFSVKRKTKAEAEKTAKHWFETHSAELEREIERLRVSAEQGCVTIDTHVQTCVDTADEANEVIKRRQKEIDHHASEVISRVPNINAEDAAVLYQRAAELREKPEASYSYEDWNTRAHAASSSGKPEEAGYMWGLAAAIPNAGAEKVAIALFNRGVTLGPLGHLEEAVKALDEVVTRFGQDPSKFLKELVAKALVNKAVTLGKNNLHDDEIKVYDEVVNRFGEENSLGLRVQVARALVSKGVALGNLTLRNDEIKAYDEVVNRYGQDRAPALREQVAMALVNKGVAQGKLAPSEDESKLFDEVVSRYGNDPAPSLRKLVASALFNKGCALERLGRSEDENNTFDELVDRFRQDQAPITRELVAKALVNRGSSMAKLGQYADEIKLYDDVVACYGQDPEQGLRETVSRALYNKGVALRQLGQNDDAIKVFRDVVACYGQDTAPGLREAIADSLNGIGFAMLLQAKKVWTSDPNTARANLVSAQENLERAMTYMSKPSGMILGNQAYVAWLLGDAASSETLFKSALAAKEHGGKALYDGTLEDLAKHPIAEDEGFRSLVERLWEEHGKNVGESASN